LISDAFDTMQIHKKSKYNQNIVDFLVIMTKRF
jgi:hypothetical protein